MTHPPWPHRRLDVAALRRSGRRPTPVREYVLKVHQRCNLACDYCYVYELADRSWRDRPALMAPAIWRAAAARIGAHARRHALDRVRVVLHGGEPLLAGTDHLIRLITDVRRALPDGCELDVGLQTNGVLLTAEKIRVLADHNVSIGVSVDGTPQDHDRHRTYRNGTGTHEAVDRAVRLLSEPRFRPAFAGLLCTVNPATDPAATYAALLRHDPPAIDLLLPHANWATPPARPPGHPAPHGAWLAEVFDLWYDADQQHTGIRLFEDVMSLLLGGPARSEQIGLSPAATLVIESDGTIEQVDALKSAYPGACETGLSVLTDPIDAALDHPGVAARQLGVDALSPACTACPLHQICGAGHYAHRYRAGEGFHNPTVYCADMQVLIHHVHGRLSADLARLSAVEAR